MCPITSFTFAAAALGREPDLGSIHFCPHAPRSGCPCRKPRPGLLLKAMAFWGVGPHETLYVGDMDVDEQAALAAGVRFAWAWNFFGWAAPDSDC